RGWVVGEVDRAPLAVAYEILTDGQCTTRRVTVTVSPEGRTLAIEHDGNGRWTVDGDERPDLSECRDVDLGISPSTNTLPIRRLGLEVGEFAHLEAAWVDAEGRVVRYGDDLWQAVGTLGLAARN